MNGHRAFVLARRDKGKLHIGVVVLVSVRGEERWRQEWCGSVGRGW